MSLQPGLRGCIITQKGGEGVEKTEEKKVEYIELIYDLIFVYLIGRSSSLLDRLEGGFVSAETFVNFVLSSLIFLQIWNYSTLYINRYGKNSLSDKLMMLSNMFLMYVMGANTIHGWNANYFAYMGAWCLALMNLALQYLLKLRDPEFASCGTHIRQNVVFLLVQTGLIAASMVYYGFTGTALGQWAVLMGFLAVPGLVKNPANFAHLTERVMLYVVFTFGEMIIIVAEYFADGLSFETVYFAMTSFLIVAGLFFSYGYIYDRCIDRSGERSGYLYLLLHVFIILSLALVTASLEFMREPEVDSLKKTVMMVASILVYFLGLALTERWSYKQYKVKGQFLFILAMEFALYAVLGVMFVGSGYALTLLTVGFVYVQLGTLLLSGRITKQRE